MERETVVFTSLPKDIQECLKVADSFKEKGLEILEIKKHPDGDDWRVETLYFKYNNKYWKHERINTGSSRIFRIDVVEVFPTQKTITVYE